jgi:5-methylcytosine-specific restriction endonuclease McrA
MRKNRILVQDPHPLSHAAYLLLKDGYAKCVVCTDGYRGWLKFRADLLTKWEKERGGLFCHYCGKGPLPVEDLSYKKVATIDHFIPLSKGGEKFDPNNLVVSCYKCNSKKKDNMPP